MKLQKRNVDWFFLRSVGLLEEYNGIFHLGNSFFCYQCFTNEDALILRHLSSSCGLPNVAQDVIDNCKELKCFTIKDFTLRAMRGLYITHIYNLQQYCVHSPCTNVHIDFMTSVSAHGGLVHVVMCVKSLTGKGVTPLVLKTLHLCTKTLYAI